MKISVMLLQAMFCSGKFFILALLSYFSACSFLEVYEMAIDTILICFFLNKECAGESIKKVINMEEKEFSKKDEKAGGDEGKPVKSTKKTEII